MKLFFLLFLMPLLVQAANEIPSPNMAMPIPAVGITKGPIYATDINNSLLIVDKHDHSPGNGVPITPSGLNINADLTMSGNNLTSLRSTRYTAQSSPLTGASPDLGALYVSGVDLYYNDVGGNQIRITSGGSVAGAAGTITGLPSGTASAAFVSLSGTYVLQQATSSAGNIDAGTYVLRYPGSYPTPSGNYIALEAPSSLATGYALTFPSTLPATLGSWMTYDTVGNASWTKVDNSTLQYSTNTISVKALGVTASQIANNTITSAQISPSAGITGSQMASGTITNSNITANTITLASINTSAANYGLYTPGLGSTNVNVASYTLRPAQWLRVGNTVTMSQRVDVTAGGTSGFTISWFLPIASIFTAQWQAMGVCVDGGNTFYAGIQPLTSSQVSMAAPNAAANGTYLVFCTLTYQVL